MHRRGLGQLVGRDLGQPEVTDLSLGHEFGHGADGVGERDGRVDTVQVVQVDHIDAEPPQ